jgi:hypothetical protein
MIRSSIAKVSWLALCSLVLLTGTAAAQAQATIGGYQLVGQRRVASTVTEFVYRATLTNNGPAIQSATATLTGTPLRTSIIDGGLTFGPIAAGGTGLSTDTFTIRQTTPSLGALLWTVNVVPAGGGSEAVKLRIRTVGNVQAGSLFSVFVDALDASDSLDTAFSGQVTLGNLAAAAPANGQTVFASPAVASAVAGTATFSVFINNAADGYTFDAASGALSGSSNAFNVTATHLTIATALANRQAGTVFGLTVEGRDANNALAENFTSNVNLNASAVGGSNFTGGQQTVAAAGGTATFAGLTLNNAADNYTATAASAGVTSALSNTFNVTFTTLSVLPVTSVAAGTLFGVQVEARDAGGALAENFAAGSALTLINLQAAVVANGQTAFNAAAVPVFGGGVATFSVAINNAANGYTFSATATSAGNVVTDALNAAFNVTASHLTVTTAIANQTAGSPFALSVEARDGNNVVAENFTSNVNLNAAATGGANFDGGQKTVAAVAGAASFAGLVLSTPANGYTVAASAAGVTSGVSNAFNVTGNGGGNGDAETLELDLSQSTVGAGGVIGIAATVRDDLGEAISPTPLVVYQVVADEGSSGTPPAVVGNQITTASDTRGGFILVGTVNGTTVTDEVLFAVTQTAAESKNAAKFLTLAAAEGTVGLKLDELLAAFEGGNLAAIPAINTALQNAKNSVLLTGRNAVQRGTPVTPELGFLPSIAQLNAAGLTETPADQAFRLLIPQIVTKLDQIRAFYDALPTNPAAGGGDSVAALNQLNTELSALQAQLESLDITPHAIVRNATALNNLIRDTMPRHLHSLVGKIGGVLSANGLASLDATPTEFLAGAPELVSPADFYGQPQPAFFGLAGLMGGMSLQMNLVNRIYGPVMAQVSRMMVLLAADALLQEYLNTASFEGIITGASLSFHVFNSPDSVIEGSGMNRENVASNEVFLIGGAAIQAVQGVISAFNPSNVDSLDDVYDYFEGIVDALQAAGQAYDQAEQPPSSVQIGCILDGGSNANCSELVYPAGFESVSGCSGIFCFQFPVLILYHNKDTGHWASGLFNFVPE